MTESERITLLEKKVDAIEVHGSNIIYDSAIRLLEQDPHQFSHRPCSTCHTVSGLLGRPFGCERSTRPPT